MLVLRIDDLALELGDAGRSTTELVVFGVAEGAELKKKEGQLDSGERRGTKRTDSSTCFFASWAS